MLLSIMPIPTFASVINGPDKLDYQTVLKSDPDTSEVPEGLFGGNTRENDGRIWTDKSVTAREDGTFDVKLSALGQEYVATLSSIKQGEKQPAADILVLVDSTCPMKDLDVIDSGAGSTDARVSRVEALVQGITPALKTIIEEDPNNRLMQVHFGTWTGSDLTPRSDVLMPLGRYSLDGIDGVFDYNGLLKPPTMSLKTGVLKDGAPFSGSTRVAGERTAQQGIARGAQNMISAISAEEYSGIRKPFVLLFTHGEPAAAHSTWANPNLSVRGDVNGELRRDEAAALTTLSAAYFKDQITQSYRQYNNDDTIDTTWFNISLMVEPNSDSNVRSFLDPSFINNANASTPSALAVKQSLANHTTNTYATSNGLTGYGEFANYNYTSVATSAQGASSNFVYYADSTEALNNAFREFANIAIADEKVVVSPASTFVDEASGQAGKFVIRDTLGEGMELKSAPKISFDEGENFLTLNTETLIEGGSPVHFGF